MDGAFTLRGFLKSVLQKRQAAVSRLAVAAAIIAVSHVPAGKAQTPGAAFDVASVRAN